MSNAENGALSDLAAAYALGALEPEETRQFETLLATSPDLRREVAEYREVGALLASDSADTPDPSGWDRVRNSIASHRREVLPFPKGRSRPRLATSIGWGAAAAAVLLAVGLGLKVRDLSRDLTATTIESGRTADRLAARERMLDEILGASTVFVLTSAAAPEPAIRIYWNRETNIWVLHAFNLTPAASGRVYQLWFIQDGDPVPSVTFNSEADGHALLTAPGPAEAAGLTAAAVTEEPLGGSAQPTSTPILVGTVSPG